MASLEERDERLREAAASGNVGYLRNCIASKKPNEYYLSVFTPNPRVRNYGNIFHIATYENREEFLRVAIEELLPLEVVQKLLCQQDSEQFKRNPLHLAAILCNFEIVRLFLDAFKKPPSKYILPKPWLQTNDQGRTPCHMTLVRGDGKCGLELLKMDKQLLSNMLDNEGNSLLYLAVFKGLHIVATEILTSPHSFSSAGRSANNALHCVPKCSGIEEGKNVCRLLLKNEPELIKARNDNGSSILHSWAKEEKLWPYKCLLDSDDIIPNVRRVFVDMISITDKNGRNPIHHLSFAAKSRTNRTGVVEIGKLLVDTYLQEKAQASSSSSNISTGQQYLQFPWLVKDKFGSTPLDIAITQGFEEFAVYILSVDKNALQTCRQNVLFMAMDKRFNEAPQRILDIVNEKGWIHLLSNDRKLNALHLAPKCKKEFCEQLLKSHPELLKGVDKEGNTVLHMWVRIGQLWPFEYVLKNAEMDRKWRSHFVNLVSCLDFKGQNNPIHIAAACTHEAAHQIVKLLVEAFQEEHPSSFVDPMYMVPWWIKNKAGEGALHLAIRIQRDQQIALYLLSSYQKTPINDLLDYYLPNKHWILFLAILNNSFQLVKMILTRLNKASWTIYLKNSSTGRSVLHLASHCTDKELGRWLVKEAPEFIAQPDLSGMTPLDEASTNGAAWIVEAMLEQDPSAFNKAPLAWVKACEKGHVPVIRVFIEFCPAKFSDHCIHHQDSPLHHIRLRNLMGYEEFLNIPYMKDLINLQDAKGATPLHKAIQDGNILLAETLLNMDKIRYNITDDEGKTARYLLEQLCKEQPQWHMMCKSIGFDPSLKTSYFQRKTNLLDVRNTLSVVAALLATITFTAGFTLPGGFNQDNGEAILAKKTVFLVFLISDTIAMCFSMLVLICLIWSMVFEPNKSLFLIDRSVGLLRVALYSTLLAFMAGVYIVISPMSLWAAILVIAICSLVGVSANMTLLYKVLAFLDKLTPSANKEREDPIRLMELGIPNNEQERLLNHQGESSQVS